MTRTKITPFRLSPVILAAVDEIAELCGLTRAAVVRAAITDYVKKYRRAEERARKAT